MRDLRVEEREMIDWDAVLEQAKNGSPAPDRRVEKSDEEWRAELDPQTYRVTRKGGTEPAFSSEMCSRFEAGLYACACCSTMLFDAGAKFESGTGWPSFTAPIADDVVAYHSDTSFGMQRIEAVCNVCDAHLGHVFPDGPKESSGLRFCINAVALKKRSERPSTP